jgi:uncharacterized membrane protein
MVLARIAAESGGLSGALIQFADPWSKIVAHSKAVSASVLFFHLVPLIIAGGSAFAADRATLRVASADHHERRRQLQELVAIHRVVVIGLGFSFISGLLLFLADVETFLGSVFLWIKLALVAVLLVNGWMMTVTERDLARAGENQDAAIPLWRRLQTLAVLSVALWIATTLAGVVLKEFA